MTGFVIGLALLALPFLGRTPLDQTIQRVEQSVVRIAQGEDSETTATRICTGFVVESGAEGRVVTAAHCVGDWHGLQVDANPATVVMVDPGHDLALLATVTTKPPVTWSLVIPARFEMIVGIGYGDGMSRPVAVERQVVIQMIAPRANEMPPGLLVGPGWIHGMSGGPAVNTKGEVIGIIQRTNDSNTLGYGVTTETILRFLLATPTQ